MKYYFIFNPGSKSGKSGKMISKIRDILDSKRVYYECAYTEKIDDAYRFSREANLNNYDVVAAVGGDGTINGVINGFYDNNGKRISKSKLGVVYTGTSPDFCRSYGIPCGDIKKSVDVVLGANSKEITVGKVLRANGAGPGYFACCANAGIGAGVAGSANNGARSILGDYCGTLASILRAFAVFKPITVNINVDGRQHEFDKVYNVSIGKTRFVASGIKINSNVAEGDRRFYIVVVRDVAWRNLVSCLVTLYGGRPINGGSEISMLYGSKIKIESSDEETGFEYDGDPHGHLPCCIEAAENKLEIMI